MTPQRHRRLASASLTAIAHELDELASRAGRILDARGEHDAEATLAILASRCAELARKHEPETL